MKSEEQLKEQLNKITLSVFNEGRKLGEEETLEDIISFLNGMPKERIWDTEDLESPIWIQVLELIEEKLGKGK